MDKIFLSSLNKSVIHVKNKLYNTLEFLSCAFFHCVFPDCASSVLQREVNISELKNQIGQIFQWIMLGV